VQKAAFINWISPDAKPVQVVSFPEDITAGGLFKTFYNICRWCSAI